MTPLDLARWRALADEAEESLHSIALLWQEMQAAMRRREPVHPNDIGNDPITVSAKAAELATALRAACDEVERLREALDIERERRIITVGTMAEHIADVQAAFVEGMRCTGSSEEVALDMWRHSDALGKLRHTGAFEQAYLGQESPHAK